MKVAAKAAQVPKLRFPGFEGEWRLCALGELASVKHGFAFDGEHFSSEGDFIVLTPGNFTADGAFRYQGAKEKFYTSNQFPQEYVLSRGDLLMVMTEQAVGLIGCTLLVPEDGRLLHNQRLGLIQIHGTADAEYLHRYFKTERMRVALSKTGAGTKVRHTSPKRIEGLQINLPTIPEQQKIAAFLTAVDGRIEQLSRKKALLEAYKKGVMQQLFTQTLRFQDDQGHDFPDWEEKTLGDFFTFKNGYNAEKDQYGKGTKFINVLDVLSSKPITHDSILGRVDIPEKEFAKFEVTYGDILFQRSSETREEVGQANVYLDREHSAVFGGFVIRGKPIREFDPLFMNYLLRTPIARNEITSKSGGSTRYNVSQDTLAEARIVLPPSLPEQTKIAGFLSALDGKIGAVGEQMRQTQVWKKGLLQQLFV